MSRISKTDEEKVVVKSVSIEIDTLLKALERSKGEFRGNLSFYVNALIEKDAEDVTISQDDKNKFLEEMRKRKEANEAKKKEKEEENKKAVVLEVKAEEVKLEEVKAEPVQIPARKRNSFRLSAIDSVMSMGED